MKNILKRFIYLFIINISIVSIHSYEHTKFVNNDKELIEILHENFIESVHKRVKRAAGDDPILFFDGSGPVTTETSTSMTPTTMNIESTTDMINRTSIGQTTDQTSLSVTSSLTQPTITTAFNCNTTTYIYLSNETCISKIDAQKAAVNILRSRTANAADISYALTLYIDAVTNQDLSSNPNYTLSPGEIDGYVENLDNITLNINSYTSFIMIKQLNLRTNITMIGGVYTNNSGGEVIDNPNLLNTSFTVAAIIQNQSLFDARSVSMLIIPKPTMYENVDRSNNKTLASSVIVAGVQRNISRSSPMNISLYFQVLNEYRPAIEAIYSCSYYDTNNQSWNNFGCTTPSYNQQFNRYECNCNHLSTFALTWSPNTTACPSATPHKWTNGTCLSQDAIHNLAIPILKNTTNGTVIADTLSIYINAIITSNQTNLTDVISINDVDTYLNRINNVTLVKNTSQSILMAQPPYQDNNVIVLGASFIQDVGGQVVKNTNKDNVLQSNLSAAAIISNTSLVGVTSLNILIIGQPTAYRNIDNTTKKTLASSIIIASLKTNSSLTTPSINISLYFQVLDQWKPNTTTNVDYYCSFYDTDNQQWNESGCTTPTYNQQFNRYECTCNHLTSFALLWLPQSSALYTPYLNAQDIASLVFQSLSIICFLFILIHAIVIKVNNPLLMTLKPYDLLPLVSCASTTLLFTFYIALGMTVYTNTTSQSQTQCFQSSSVLMFIVYFLLIFMFCTKTSVGYFNYLRFVYLFPQPSLRKLFYMLILSFMISLACVLLAIGFNSNASFEITYLYAYKLCWFNRRVIYYFLTIPVCIFLLLNIILFIVVTIRIINHARYVRSRHQSYNLMKRCILVLLSSCLTQGIGWLFGPFLTIVSSTAGEVLGWFFIIFNGLEGVYSLILYIIIVQQHKSEQKRITAARDCNKLKNIKTKKRHKSSVDNTNTTNVIQTPSPEIEDRNEEQQETSFGFDNIYEVKTINLPTEYDYNTISSSL